MPGTPLPGQDTLLSCWRALAGTRFGPGRLVDTGPAMAAVFPDFAPFNNAILTAPVEFAPSAVRVVADEFEASGVVTWALWVPSRAGALDGPPVRTDAVATLVRDVTTLVMTRPLAAGLRTDERATAVSASALYRLVAEEPVPVHELGEPEAGDPIVGWALVVDGRAVTSAYTHVHGTDIGIYAVETLPAWRRRGHAGALLEHILADAHARGLRTSSLQSTPMGQPLYTALGFKAQGRYEEWLHRSADVRQRDRRW